MVHDSQTLFYLLFIDWAVKSENILQFKSIARILLLSKCKYVQSISIIFRLVNDIFIICDDKNIHLC